MSLQNKKSLYESTGNFPYLLEEMVLKHFRFIFFLPMSWFSLLYIDWENIPLQT